MFPKNTKEVSMKKIFSVCLATFFLLGFTVSAWALGLEVAAGVWQEDPNGFIAYQGDQLTTEDLGFGQETKVYGRAKVDLPLVNLYFMVTPVKFEGTGNKVVSFSFGGKTFSANIPFDAELQLDQYDIGLYWGLPFLKTATKAASAGQASFNLELGLDVKVVDLKARITQGTLSEEKTYTVPVPMLYVGAGLEVWKLAFEAEARGISYDGSYLYDLIGRVKIVPLKFPLGGKLFLEGGYRYEKIKLDDIEDVTGALEIVGPFFGVGGSF